MISVIDYGVGNIGSVRNMIKKSGGESRLVSSPEDILTSNKLLLPGVGAFDAGVMALRSRGLDEAIIEAISDKSAYILGICLGMQLLLDSSEEGILPGLGVVPGVAKRFDADRYSVCVPHMGWNLIRQQKESLLFDEMNNEEIRFYFVHSYYVECFDSTDIVSLTDHGHEFVSSFQRGRILGAQFHPEKSHRFGMALFKKYSEL